MLNYLTGPRPFIGGGLSIRLLRAELHHLRQRGGGAGGGGAVVGGNCGSTVITTTTSLDRPNLVESFSQRVCARCQCELGRIINRGAPCRVCRLRVCKACREFTNRTTDWVCLVCHKQMWVVQVASKCLYLYMYVIVRDKVPVYVIAWVECIIELIGEHKIPV